MLIFWRNYVNIKNVNFLKKLCKYKNGNFMKKLCVSYVVWFFIKSVKTIHLRIVNIQSVFVKIQRLIF